MVEVAIVDLPITIPKLRVLLTGGTGYIGGSILTALLRNPDFQVTTLIRSAAAIETLISPANPKFFTGSIPVCVEGTLTDLPLLRRLASEADIVVNCASTSAVDVVEALITGLSENQAKGKKIFIHTSCASAFATTNLNIRDKNGEEKEDQSWRRGVNDTEDLISLMKEMNQVDGEQNERTAALKATELAEEKGIKSYVIVPGLVYGEHPSTHLPHHSPQIQHLIQRGITTRSVPSISRGAEEAGWPNVHLSDLTALYLIIIRCALSGVASEGFYFAANGHRTWKEISDGVKSAVEELEDFQGTIEVEAAGTEQVSGLVDGREILGTSVNITPDRSLKLGWEPVFGEDFILESIKKDAAVIWRESQESNRSPSGGVDGET